MRERYLIVDEGIAWDEKAFHDIYNRFYQALVMYSLNTIGNQGLSEDIVQDIFSVIWESKTQFNSIVSLRVYLYNSVRNRMLDILRRKKVENRFLQKQPYLTEIDAENSYVKEEVYNQLFAAIDRLPKRQREVLLHTMEKRKVKEIAEFMNISVTSVKTQKQRAIETLRKTLTNPQWLLLLNMIQ
ncbi:MAG: sigma-70 family RNA polymerase sigma factor [Prevotella sp.]|nr:sigma-70 family RNA polymerase sigma factor [Prevotella sp.]